MTSIFSYNWQCRFGPNHADNSVYGIDKDPEAVLHFSDSLTAMDVHTVIHKRLYGQNLANQPVLLIEAFHPAGLKKIKIRHYDPRSIGEILYKDFRMTEFDLCVSKVSNWLLYEFVCKINFN